MSTLVEVERVVKTFVRRRRRGLRVERTEHRAVDDLSFTIAAGEFVAEAEQGGQQFSIHMSGCAR